MMNKRTRRLWEWIVERAIGAAGLAAIAFVLLILGFLLRDSLPLLKTASLRQLFTETRWLPTSDPAKFGLLPLLLGSFIVTLGALIIAVPLGWAAPCSFAKSLRRGCASGSSPPSNCSRRCPPWCSGSWGC